MLGNGSATAGAGDKPAKPRPASRFVLVCFGLFCLGLLLANAAYASTNRIFLAARNAYAHGRIARFEHLSARVPKRYLLRVYLDYWRLKSRSAPPEAWAKFAVDHADSPLSEKAWQYLARFYGHKEDWPHFRRVVGKLNEEDTEIICYDLRGRLARGDPKAVERGLSLWLTSQDLPSSCDPLFAQLAAAGYLTKDKRLARLRLALEANNLSLAKKMITGLTLDSRSDIHRLILAHEMPEAILAADAPTPVDREIVYYALYRVAIDDPERAVRVWQSWADECTKDQRRYGWGVIALATARQLKPQAVTWFLAAHNQLSKTQDIWKARTMLRAGRWLEVYKSIIDMPQATQYEPEWRYWKARALKALHATVRANRIFAALSHGTHYYNLLASEELPERITSQPADYSPSPREIHKVASLRGIKRALLLYKLGLDFNAASEWQWAIRNFSDHQLLAAAELARRVQWYDRAIDTAERTKTTHNMDLRYLAPYRDLADADSSKNSLDPAWVYGLMRQESRFKDHARSWSGARGLMQIMPATARWIARHLGLGRWSYHHFARPDINIRFGTYYLRKLLDGLDDSTVLATAGYNAGPNRAREWQAKVPLEGAIYVETIPIPETREYVKKVLANAMFYSRKLGQQDGDSLKERLGVVPAQTVVPAPGHDRDPNP